MKPIVASVFAAAAFAFVLSAVATNAQSKPDVAAGKKIFTANCSTCHGATGVEGGVGPSLRDETQRKSYPQIVAWIKNPQPPMPKLYPSPLSATDVNNVAAYVASIK